MTKFKTLTLKERIGIAKKVGKKARKRAIRFGKATKIRIEKVQATATQLEKASADFAKKHPTNFGDDMFFTSRKRQKKRKDDIF